MKLTTREVAVFAMLGAIVRFTKQYNNIDMLPIDRKNHFINPYKQFS